MNEPGPVKVDKPEFPKAEWPAGPNGKKIPFDSANKPSNGKRGSDWKGEGKGFTEAEIKYGLREKKNENEK